MKREIRKIVTTLLAITVLLALGSCGVPAAPAGHSAQPPAASVPEVPSAPVEPAPAAAPDANPLTRAQAEAIALNHAGLTAGQVKGLRSEFDIDDGVKEWSVEFHFDGWEYDYEIHAVSGAIRSFDKDWD